VYAPTGAIAAAATTSLPEIPGGDWNWDYRFSWVRDSWMTVRSLADAGFREEADGFHRFIERSSAGAGAELQLMYGVDGRHRTPEIDLDELSGYRGAGPVRIGNAAQVQLQLDMYGYLLELTWQRVCQGAAIEDALWRFVVELVDIVCRRRHEPDHGIWELRGQPQHYTYSKVQCWVAIDRGLRLARVLDRLDDVDGDRWRASCDDVRAAIDAEGVRDGRFVATFGRDDVDASLLLVPEFGYVEPTDPLMAATVDAVIERLDHGGLVRRFRPGDTSGTEGTFVACTFWLVERLVDLDRHDEACEYFERAAATANDLGLFAEEYDADTDEMLGNFPQALSHLSHLAAVHALRVG
jgi:GH15 family glucan-1,4-alpha-glucosidase